MAFTKDGRLYAARHDPDSIQELDPNTGAVLRTVVNITEGLAPLGLAVDPLSGDLFVSHETIDRRRRDGQGVHYFR